MFRQFDGSISLIQNVVPNEYRVADRAVHGLDCADYGVHGFSMIQPTVLNLKNANFLSSLKTMSNPKRPLDSPLDKSWTWLADIQGSHCLHLGSVA